jgi:nitroreductase
MINTVIETILNRKSVRQYTGRPVSREDLTRLVRAGMAAPCSYNKRCWYFVVIDDSSVIAGLMKGLPNAQMMASAGQAIVVLADVNLSHGGAEVPYWIQDCSAAVENILIAAESMGLGACWTGVCPRDERVAFVRRVLGTPDNIVPFCVIAIGYSTGEERPQEKFDPARIFWNRWEERGA